MLLTTLIIGLFGAALMFCGDMTLYYNRNDFEQNGSLDPIIDIMKKLPRKRVMLGGWIGTSYHHNSENGIKHDDRKVILTVKTRCWIDKLEVLEHS